MSKMKKYKYIAAAMLMGIAFTACETDEPDTSMSVIKENRTEPTELDLWLQHNFNKPYNIDFKFRYEDVEGDFGFYLVPARYSDAIIMAHLIKYLCIETYNEVGGTDFTRRYFPKMFYLVGEWEYYNNGTIVLGTAEKGRKILLAGMNYLTQYIQTVTALNHYYFKTIHHEFTHILNQTKPIPSDYQFVTGTGYVAALWSEPPYSSGYVDRGFITAYAQHSYSEDFAEMLSTYVTRTEEKWKSTLETTNATARKALVQKLEIIRNYMHDNFNIDIDHLRSVLQRRQTDVVNGKIDLYDLTIQ